jgi:hypothetical protein
MNEKNGKKYRADICVEAMEGIPNGHIPINTKPVLKLLRAAGDVLDDELHLNLKPPHEGCESEWKLDELLRDWGVERRGPYTGKRVYFEDYVSKLEAVAEAAEKVDELMAGQKVMFSRMVGKTTYVNAFMGLRDALRALKGEENDIS